MASKSSAYAPHQTSNTAKFSSVFYKTHAIALHFALERVFAFEYSETGDNRRGGSITTLGNEVISVYTGPVLLKDIE